MKKKDLWPLEDLVKTKSLKRPKIGSHVTAISNSEIEQSIQYPSLCVYPLISMLQQVAYAYKNTGLWNYGPTYYTDLQLGNPLMMHPLHWYPTKHMLSNF